MLPDAGPGWCCCSCNLPFGPHHACALPPDHIARLFTAAQRAVESPDALADEAEAMLKGEIEE